MNKSLREELIDQTGVFKRQAKVLNNAVMKHELNEDVVLKRGISGKSLRQIGITGLGEHTLKGFTSTTIDSDTSKMFMNVNQKKKIYIEIMAPKGTKRIYISELSDYFTEREFLLPHKKKLIIECIKEKEGYTHVKARVIK